MSDPFVDTDVLIRLVTGDDPLKQERAAQLFERVGSGELTLNAPVTVIADAVYVLHSLQLYRLSRTEVRDGLAALVRLPNFRVENRRDVLDALDIFASSNLDFGDAMIIASMRSSGAGTLFSYDADFDRFNDIERRTP